jgi:uncharacterized protein
MKNKLNQVFLRRTSLIVFLIGFSIVSVAQKNRAYKPEELPVPVFDSIGFIIDPDKKIIDEWHREIISTRETYYFPRYIEPVCVRVDHIREPDNLESYADKLISLWDLEKKTNGRFVFQIQCKSKKKVVYRIGSRLKVFISKVFLEDLAKDIEEVHFTAASTGTGDFVSIQRIGDHFYKEIAFDSKLLKYSNNSSKHSIYPDRVERSNGKLKVMSHSPYDEDDPIFIAGTSENTSIENTDTLNEKTVRESNQKNYYSGLSQSEIDANYNAINTSGVITKIEDVQNARLLNNSHVTDPHNLLSTDAESRINALLDTLETSAGYQVAVVCMNSIGSNDPRTWGTDLFNLWGVGGAETENGLLMLLVHDIHGIDFITGRGTEGILTDVDCYNIQQEEMVPYFKNNDYATGMIRGTQAVCDFLYGSPPIYSSSDGGDVSGSEDYDYDYYDDYSYEQTSFYESDFFRFYSSAAIVFTGIWLLFFIFSFLNKDLYKRYNSMKFFTLLIFPILFPIPYLPLFLLTRSFMNKWRNTTRFSEKTGEEMFKLDDLAEDKHLSKGQLSEEKVKSIDHDVWVTYKGDDVLILSYKKWFSKYNKCPSCKYKTYFKLYDKTISSATYTSSGTGERCYKCENCGHQKIERYTIPRKTKSSSSGGSSGGYSSGSSSRSSSSGGGSSYGGGSSRGGGAGSRW